jgi:ubiquinone/menaquinone biosynthesis C-methylase UbiE
MACQTAPVPPHRDLAAFEERAIGYEEGWRGRLHHEIADRTANLALDAHAAPRRVLDIGCGTGYLLRRLAQQCPQARHLAGIDPAPSMIQTAAASARDERLQFSVGTAERLPYGDGSFDLIVTTTSFDHWADQLRGLHECARVLVAGGLARAGRPVLALARSHADRGPSRQGAHPQASRPAAERGRLHVHRLARSVRRDHQGRDGNGPI